MDIRVSNRSPADASRGALHSQAGLMYLLATDAWQVALSLLSASRSGIQARDGCVASPSLKHQTVFPDAASLSEHPHKRIRTRVRINAQHRISNRFSKKHLLI